jgi:flagellar biosynthesis/type III secretory pathway ATPase
LIRIGAYQKDSDPVLDNAVRILPALNAFLLQLPDTQSSYAEAVDLLMALAN